MTATIRVLAPGLRTTVQDLGRWGLQSQGVPVSGAMDTFALRCANLLVGNEEGAAALEIALLGPSLLVERPALLALTGAELGATVDGRPVASWRPVFVPAGSTIAFRGAPQGAHGYLAFAGGIDVAPVLGSRSTYLPAAFGGYGGRSLRVDDKLLLGDMSPRSRARFDGLRGDGRATIVARWGVGPSVKPRYPIPATVRVVEGMHSSLLSDESRDRLFGQPFRVTSQSDRMGYRLTGQRLTLREPVELLSEGVTFGTIQLPPSGEPIVLMADRQTTGGYPRVGEVASVDLPALAQLRPGDELRFKAIDIDTAQRLSMQREADLITLTHALNLEGLRPKAQGRLPST
jgi:antagonist of KipI